MSQPAPPRGVERRGWVYPEGETGGCATTGESQSAGAAAIGAPWSLEDENPRPQFHVVAGNDHCGGGESKNMLTQPASMKASCTCPSASLGVAPAPVVKAACRLCWSIHGADVFDCCGHTFQVA